MLTLKGQCMAAALVPWFIPTEINSGCASFIHSFIHSFVHSFILFVCFQFEYANIKGPVYGSGTRPVVYSDGNQLRMRFIHSFVRSFIHSFIRSFCLSVFSLSMLTLKGQCMAAARVPWFIPTEINSGCDSGRGYLRPRITASIWALK